MATDDVLASLFDDQAHHLAEPMAAWLASSRRFAAFVTTFHTKIRKKIRAAQEPESLRDLQLELETAYVLLRERSLSLVYEPQPARQARGPDFAVSFTTSLVFMVEVTRLRAGHSSHSPQEHTLLTQSPAVPVAAPLLGERFVGMLGSKLGQLSPQHSNLLVVGVEVAHLTHHELHAAMIRIQQRAENNDATIVQRNGFRDRADFFHHYQRLSAVLVRETPFHVGEPVIVWDNAQAKYPLPGKVHTALSRSHAL